MSRIVLITGATGLIGSQLAVALQKRGDSVIALTTNPEAAKSKLPGAEIVPWDKYLSLSSRKVDAVINLAGVNLGGKRWNDEFKKKLYGSRIGTTTKIAGLISEMPSKPEVLLSASGVDYYGDRGEDDVYEDSPHSDDFIGRLCSDWEKEAFKAENLGVRVVVMRTGFVIARHSKAVKRLALPFRFFIGGPPGSGKQYMSWIHIDDVTGVYLYSLDNNSVKGPVNASAPNPETMKNFCRNLAGALHRPSLFRIPGFFIKIAAGGVSSLVLQGRRALPDKIMKLGYRFKFTGSADAWRDIFA